ncbi:hypothetical protein WMY93_018661 [Mugilogobius chulae]|uniref:Ryanodine receptor 2b (cardiac) n=1 Tax=Mugilogobius chulae TaxID=88201 RepID=A0AAW0NUU8_9GOBI
MLKKSFNFYDWEMKSFCRAPSLVTQNHLSLCGFVLAQCLSVRALQEMLAHSEQISQKMGADGSHRTLLYGQAVLFLHSYSGMYLSCMFSSQSSTDKLAFDVGLQDNKTDETCWWIVHPASRQRSDGEKVRVGDDVILVNISSERYLHLSTGAACDNKYDNIVVSVAFQHSLWRLGPVCSGGGVAQGFVRGGDTLRLLHSHSDACLTVSSGAVEEDFQRELHYDTAASNRACSLWRLEILQVVWSGSHTHWAQPFRLCHLTTGQYLGFTGETGLHLVNRDNADVKTTAFCFRPTKEKLEPCPNTNVTGMGTADIKYGDSTCFIQHVYSGLWLTYSSDAKSTGSLSGHRKAILHSEGHMDDGLTLSRAQNEDCHTARLIRSAALLFTSLNRKLDGQRGNSNFDFLLISTVICSVVDLIDFFKPPSDELDIEAKQKILVELRKRQKMFQEEGIINLVLECIDQLHQFNDVCCEAETTQSEGIKQWEELIKHFYKILAALIRGNRANCAQFSVSLEWLVSKLERHEASSGVLEVLHFILLESPEAVNLIKEEHIESIVGFLDRHGYNHKVMHDTICSEHGLNIKMVRFELVFLCIFQVLEVLSSLCMCHGTAVRSNQNLICDSLLPYRDLLLQTRLINQVISIRPNIFLSMEDNSAQPRKWYYELVIDHVDHFVTPEPTHLRVGWASTQSYKPRPSGGNGWGCNGVGDDLSSFGFDGLHLWSGAVGRRVNSLFPHLLKDNDVVSCCLDLSAPCISFRVNGLPVQGMMENFHADGFLFPVVSLSAGVRIRFLFGGKHGEFRFLPPPGFAPCCEALLPKNKLRVEPCQMYMFDREDGKQLVGPTAFCKPVVFIPNPIDISKTMLPLQLENIRRKLAENSHELWVLDQVELGWTSGTVRLTIIAFGFHIELSDEKAEEKIKYISLSTNSALEKLVDLLAENDHNVWAKEHIKQGWAYGAQQDVKAKQSPNLVPYSQLEVGRRRMVRARARDAVCTLLVHGYNLESIKKEWVLCCDWGKWYFEFEVLTCGNMRVGWARPGCAPDRELGSDDQAFVFSGDEAQWYHQGGVPLGTLPWQRGDVVGCMLDMSERTIKVALNGDLLFNEKGSELVAKDFLINDGLLPVVGLGVNQMGKLNLGSEPDSLQYYSVCGLQEGYKPFAADMASDPSLWLTWWHPQFASIKPDDHTLLITRMTSLKDVVPSLRVSQRSFSHQNGKKETCFYRLNMSVECAVVLSSPVRTVTTVAPNPLSSARREQEELDSDFEVLMKSAHNFTGSRDELNHHKDHSQDKTSKLKQKFMLKRTKPGLVSSNSSARLLEDVLADKDNMNHLIQTSKYYYSVRVLPGQAPSNVWVGWVTADFHQSTAAFDIDKVHTVTITLVTIPGRSRRGLFNLITQQHIILNGSVYISHICIFASAKRSNCYMVCAGEATGLSQSRRSTALEIGCLVDTSTGLLTFTSKASIKLFPAVFVKPTTNNMFQFELGNIKNVMPLSAGLFRSLRRDTTPQCPDRLQVQQLCQVSWMRVPDNALKAFVEQTENGHGWAVQSTEPCQIMSLQIPDENRCIDILELSEHDDLLIFHYHTLLLYSSLCALGNTRVCHALCSQVDQAEMFYAIQNSRLPGLLRSAFYQLLIQVHLSCHSSACLMMSQEYIVPLTDPACSISLNLNTVNGSYIPSTLASTLKPQMCFSTPSFVRACEDKNSETDPGKVCIDSPEIPLDQLKEVTMEMLSAAVRIVDGGLRDPAGGSVELLLVPLIRLFYTQLVMGVFEDAQLRQAFTLFLPQAFSDEEEDNAEQILESDRNSSHNMGLLHMKLPEAVKFELCQVLSFLCDCQVRHKVESVVAFSGNFVEKLQENQRFRYNEVMQALNMSAALTARKTKEFRSPPQEQINMLIRCKDKDEKCEDCPCPEEVQLLKEFHHLLKQHCGPELDRGSEDEEDEELSIKDQLSSLIFQANAVRKLSTGSVQKPASFAELISKTMMLWGSETKIDDPGLVKAIFSLLHRQYQGLGGQMGEALYKAYTISQASTGDTTALLTSLCQIRSLLRVRMGKQEEKLMTDKLGEIINNKVFYQHPNLMRALGMHETVMEVMVNVLGEGKTNDILFPKMVASCCRFLCYFCRISRQNQGALFDHLSYLLEHSQVGLGGKISCKCGVQSCPMLVANGYPDIAWNPVEGERYLDFLRFTVFCNGTFGGQGLLSAMEEAIRVSQDVSMDGPYAENQSNRKCDMQDLDDDIIHMGHAIMTFYSSLIDLLGRCAPETHLIQAGKGEAIRIRAILRSLIPVQDLEGVISLSFQMPSLTKEGEVEEPDLSAVFCPDHKASMVLFMDRVYGIESQVFLLHLLEFGFLPDLQAAVSLDTNDFGSTDMALALNRYITTAMLPMLTKCSSLLCDLEEQLHSFNAAASAAALTDIAQLSEHSKLELKSFEPQLYKLGAQCLTTVARSLPPDYMNPTDLLKDDKATMDTDENFDPQPVDTSNVPVPERLEPVLNKYAEHSHEKWSLEMQLCETSKVHPRLKPYRALAEKDKETYRCSVKETLKVMLAFGWTIDRTKGGDVFGKRTCTRRISQSQLSFEGASTFSPKPMDMSCITLSWDQCAMVEELAENHYNVWAMKKKSQVQGKGCRSTLAPYHVLPTKEKTRFREKAQDFLKFLLLNEIKGQQTNIFQPQTTLASLCFNTSFTSQMSLKRIFWSWVVLPLLEEYLKDHHLYFISSPFSSSTNTYASTKEKEIIVSMFCKLASLIRHRITLFGNEALSFTSCLQVLAQSVDARTLMHGAKDFLYGSLHSFLDTAAADLEMTVENLHVTLAPLTQNRSQSARGVVGILSHTTSVLLPVLTSLFKHFGSSQIGSDILVGSIQASCYRILNSLYSLGTNSSIQKDGPQSSAGACLAALSQAFPVSFLEPELNQDNPFSIYTTMTVAQIQELGLPEQVSEVCPQMPSLQQALGEVEKVVRAGAAARQAHYIHVTEVLLPMLCSYMSHWSQPDMSDFSSVTSALISDLLGHILCIIQNNVGDNQSNWTKQLAVFSQPIICQASSHLLGINFVPLMNKLRKKAEAILFEEEKIKSKDNGVSEDQLQIQEKFSVLVQDLYAFYPILIPYVDFHRASWLTEMNPDAEQLFSMVAEVFIFWAKSHNFKWEEQNYVVQNEINNLGFLVQNMTKFDHENRRAKRKGDRYCTQTSLIVASVKRLLPVGLNVCCLHDHDLINLAKNNFSLKSTKDDILKHIFQCLSSQKRKFPDQPLSTECPNSQGTSDLQENANRIVRVAQVLYHLDQVENPQRTKKSPWIKVLSKQRKRAVVACLRMTPLYNLPRHKVANLFLRGYNKTWVLTEHNSSEEKLVEDLASAALVLETGGDRKENYTEERVITADPLQQLIALFSQSALTDRDDSLCKYYFAIMAQSCFTAQEDDGEQSVQSFEEKEMEKQKLLYQQAQLHHRGASEMVLQTISGSKGQVGSLIGLTLKLGIALLNGGNAVVQQRMLEYLKTKQDVDFFQSMAQLMRTCSVLDLNAFERQNKAEGLGMVMDERTVGIAIPDNALTCDLFRFLQLLCEGHNSDFQNYLRTQTGNNMTVNIIISTVDYLLRVQESISDFYWYYSGKDVIDVFNTLTEYIQGPCTGNQQSLAHSRLWDAVVGFLHVFAHMQIKLSQDSRQIELLKEFMDLQKDMVVFLLSMLEGNVVNGTTGKQMVDMLVESSANVEMILKFFAMFLKLKDFTTSVGFREYDPDSRGCISRKDFQKAMETCNRFSHEEIQFVMSCIETDESEILDYEIFVDRFHEPAEDIGFNISVLLTNLSEHMPYDARLGTFLELAECVLGYFQPYLGRIEIVGSGKRIERVYFEISESSRSQWDKPQVKESKRQFIFDVVNESRDKEKMEMFVNFCEDTIFEMQLASNISSEAEERNPDKDIIESDKEPADSDDTFIAFKWVLFLLSLLSVKNLKMLMKMTPRDLLKSVVNVLHHILSVFFRCLFASVHSVLYVLYVLFISGGLIEAAKNMSASDVFGGFVEPTLDEVMDVSENPRKQSGSDSCSPLQELMETGHVTCSRPANVVSDIFGLQVKREGGLYRLMTPESTSAGTTDLFTASTRGPGTTAVLKKQEQQRHEYTDAAKSPDFERVKDAAQKDLSLTSQRCSTKTEEGVKQPSALWETISTYNKSALNYFARNYYNIRLLALFITFAINFILLFYKVTPLPQSHASREEKELNSSTETDNTSSVYFVLEESSGYMEPSLHFLALAHTFISFCCIIGYYCLKVPLVIFKREKEVARRLEFDGLYVTVQPPDEDIKGQWDRLVINTPSYPSNYWESLSRGR